MNEGNVHSGSGAGVEEIIALLGKGISCSDEFLALLEEELQAILKMDVRGLMSLSKRKARLVDRLQQLDRAVAMQAEAQHPEQRVASRKTMAKEGDTVVHLTAVAESCPKGQKEKLSRCREQFVVRRSAIIDKNYINRRLIEDSLGYLNDAISLLTRTSNDPSYGKSAGGKKNKSQPVMVSRAV